MTDKLISATALRAALGAALGPQRAAVLHDKTPEPVEFMGYRFTCARAHKAPGQRGYVWHYYWRGEPCTDATRARWPTRQWGAVGGNLSECAAILHSRARSESQPDNSGN